MAEQPFKPPWLAGTATRRMAESGLICGQCGAKFGTNTELNRHLQEIHPEAWASVERVTGQCECEQTDCHKIGVGPCSQSAETIVNTPYGRYKMCTPCAERMTTYLSKGKGLLKGEGNLIELLKSEDWAALMRKGWLYLRDNWPWGKTLAIKNRDGRVRFLMQGELWTGKQMAELLRDTWQPVENTREYWSWEPTIADLERLP